MERETLLSILSGGYGEILETHAMWQCIAALGVKPFKDGNKWSFLYGDNIQEGICGFGDTIYQAAWNFYHNIKTESAEWGAEHFPNNGCQKIKGWVARDKDGGLLFSELKPYAINGGYLSTDSKIWVNSSPKAGDILLPDLKWGSESIEVELSFKRLKK